jgi:uncharacterized protein YecE (DUF72 family)
VSWRELSPTIQQQAWDAFNAAVSTMHSLGKLGVVLFQFPLSFEENLANRQHILDCRQKLGREYVMAVEFRSKTWLLDKPSSSVSASSTIRQETVAWLRSHQIVLVAVDEFLEYEDEHAENDDGNYYVHRVGKPEASPATTSNYSVPILSSFNEDQAASAIPRESSAGLLSYIKEEQNEQKAENETSVGSLSSKPLVSATSIVKYDRIKDEGSSAVRERLVPIVCEITHPSIAYIRVHRRRGSNRLLTEQELDEWVQRIQSMVEGMYSTTPDYTTSLSRLSETASPNSNCSFPRIYVLWNTNFEDHSIQNSAALANRLGPLVHNWSNEMREAEKKSKIELINMFKKQNEIINKRKRKQASLCTTSVAKEQPLNVCCAGLESVSHPDLRKGIFKTEKQEKEEIPPFFSTVARSNSHRTVMRGCTNENKKNKKKPNQEQGHIDNFLVRRTKNNFS